MDDDSSPQPIENVDDGRDWTVALLRSLEKPALSFEARPSDGSPQWR